MVPRKTCGGILVKDGKILLGKRRKERLYPDIWDIFGGHVEPDETIDDSLKRELHEELGIKIEMYEFLKIYQDKDPTYGVDYIHHIYIVHSWGGEPVNNNPWEHEDIRWFSREEINDLPMHVEVREIIMDFVDF